jgi:hypothetical protein
MAKSAFSINERVQRHLADAPEQIQTETTARRSRGTKSSRQPQARFARTWSERSFTSSTLRAVQATVFVLFALKPH